MVSVFGKDGFDVKPGAWKLPALINADTRAEAAEQLAWVEGVQLATASSSSIRDWLLLLGNATASSSKLTVDDVEVKISALLALLDDYPAGVFTKASLKRSARRFRFFPGFEELSATLDSEAKDLRQRRDRLRAIASAQPAAPAAPPEVIAPATPEQAAAVRDMLAAAGVAPKAFEPSPAAVADGPVKRVDGDWSDTRQPVDDSPRAALARTKEALQGWRKVPRPGAVAAGAASSP